MKTVEELKAAAASVWEAACAPKTRRLGTYRLEQGRCIASDLCDEIRNHPLREEMVDALQLAALSDAEYEELISRKEEPVEDEYEEEASVLFDGSGVL
jgi:hypothetical protein